MIELPQHVRVKKLASGKTAYYWELPGWAKPPAKRHDRTCPIDSTPLGTSIGVAEEKAAALNEAFEQWKNGLVGAPPAKGTVRWLFAWYREQDRFKKNSAKTRADYRKLMDMLEDFPMKVGKLGEKLAPKIDATVSDHVYSKLKKRGPRQATYAMQVCRLVWNWAVRHKATTGVTENPFNGMGLKSKAAKGNYSASRSEYNLYREKARELGYQSMATAAAICFEMCQRVWDAFGYPDPDGKARGVLWDDWKPGVSIELTQSKTGKRVAIPLSHRLVGGVTELLYPDLEAELRRSYEATVRNLRLVVVEERNGKLYTERRVSKIHREICDAAGLPKDLTFTSFRHGGITELGDAGEADVRAISGHETLDTTRIYNKANAEKARRIAAKRREHIRLLEEIDAVDPEAVGQP